MATYQHILPGMRAKAASDFATLIHPVDNEPAGEHHKPQATGPAATTRDTERLPDR
jgi:hypothetical protein